MVPVTGEVGGALEVGGAQAEVGGARADPVIPVEAAQDQALDMVELLVVRPRPQILLKTNLSCLT